MLRWTVGAVICLFCFSFPALAQTPSGEISGVVTDVSGSVLPGVTVTLTNVATNAVREVETNESGLYSFPALPPGVYTLKAERQGFRTVERANIEVLVGSSHPHPDHARGRRADRCRGDHRRGAGAADREAPRSAPSSRTARIVELPLNGRNYLQLASLTPGATTNGPSSSQGRQRMGGQRNSFALNVGGQRIHYNHYSLDGVENTDLNFNSYMLLPSVDALQEFKVEAGLFDAEYGRAIAQINASTKSGTNQFHGTLFEFVRNSALDAKNYFDPTGPADPALHSATSTGSRSTGRCVLPKLFNGRNRLFFLFNWEGLRERKSLTSSPSLPLTAWRTGDFSQLRDASGNLIPIYDPATRVFDAAGNVLAGADAVPGQRHSGEPHPPGLAEACWPSIRCRSRSGPAPTS